MLIALGSLLQGCIVPSDNVKPNVDKVSSLECQALVDTKASFPGNKESLQLQLLENQKVLVNFKRAGVKGVCQLTADQQCNLVQARNKQVYSAYALDLSQRNQPTVRAYSYGYGMLQSTSFTSFRCQP